MFKTTAVELLCSKCGVDSLHQAIVVAGRLESFRCLSCNVLTAVHLEAALAQPLPQPYPELHINGLTPRLDTYQLEGTISLHDAPFMQQALRAVQTAHALREMDCRVLRLIVKTDDQIQLATTLKASTGLPVLLDIGRELHLLGSVAQSHADGLVFSCDQPGDAEQVAVALNSIFSGLVVIRTSGDDLYQQISGALTAVQTFTRWNLRRVAVTPSVQNPAHFTLIARAIRERMIVPLRAELQLSDPASGPISTSIALGTALHQPGVALTSLPGLNRDSAHIYEIVAEALLHLRNPDRDVLGSLVYVAGKAFGRVISKPRRLLHEMESTPEIFARSIPGRMISKPHRVMGEIRRLMRKSS